MVLILWFMTNTVASPDGKTVGLDLGMNCSMWETFLTTFLCSLSAMCLGLMISSITSNDMALVLCPICLMPQLLFSNVVSPLSGLTKTVSHVISCKWACLAYMISCNITDLYCKYKFDKGVYVAVEVDGNEKYVDEYSRFTGSLYHSWLSLIVICLVCIVAAILILQFRKRETR
jgi:hypothetical protein